MYVCVNGPNSAAQTTVGDIKQALCDQERMCSASVLTFKGTVLEDQRTAASYGIKTGSLLEHKITGGGTPLCPVGRGGEVCVSDCGATCGAGLSCCNGMCRNTQPGGGCFANLKWPSCAPAYTVASWIPACSDLSKDAYKPYNPESASCCLSDQTPSKTVSNCPAGWASEPTQSEWCTDDWNFFGPNKYRHKCHRVCK